MICSKSDKCPKLPLRTAVVIVSGLRRRIAHIGGSGYSQKPRGRPRYTLHIASRR